MERTQKVDLSQKEYIVILQCHIVKERCPGYQCERAFHERTGGFADYPRDKSYRTLGMTCGGCCGRATHRKLTRLLRTIAKKEGIGKDGIVVQLSSCMTNDNYHAPPCPHPDRPPRPRRARGHRDQRKIRAAPPRRHVPSIEP